jgi:hypothetical protein
MIRNLLLSVLVLFSACFTYAQVPNTNADTTLKPSPIRSLTNKQYNDYLKGTGMESLSRVSVMNHYPLPDDALRYKKELDLSPSEIKQLNDVVKFLQLKKQEIGGSAIRNERALDSLFRTHKIDEGMIIFYGNRYGLYEGEYRTVFLQACFRTQNILTAQQIRRLEALQKHN